MFSFSALCVSMVMVAGVQGADEYTKLSTTTLVTCNSALNVVRLKCEAGVIRVESAEYGQAGQSCDGKTDNVDPPNVHCLQKENRALLKKTCEGKQYCELHIKTLRNDCPCFNNYKYLETCYSCVIKVPKSIVCIVCQRSIAHLSCPSPKVIQMVSAMYGRQDGDICCLGLPSSLITNTDCSATGANCVVGARCNGHHSCSVLASDDLFNDPCPGTYKYLRLEYVCI